MNRFELLIDLVELRASTHTLSNELSKLDWDYEGEPLIVSSSQIQGVLERYLTSEIPANELENWANLIECREDLEFDPDRKNVINDIIFHLANPALQGEITPESCKKLLGYLK